jgi:hypothetical protein
MQVDGSPSQQSRPVIIVSAAQMTVQTWRGQQQTIGYRT